MEKTREEKIEELVGKITDVTYELAAQSKVLSFFDRFATSFYKKVPFVMALECYSSIAMLKMLIVSVATVELATDSRHATEVRNLLNQIVDSRHQMLDEWRATKSVHYVRTMAIRRAVQRYVVTMERFESLQ